MGEAKNLEDLLNGIEEANEGKDRIRLATAFKAVGQRSFGPMLLLPGLIAASPLSGIPGMPTLVGLMVFLIVSQLLLGREEFWLPQLVLRRSISRVRFEQAIGVIRKGARVIDRFLKPRLTFLTDGPGMYVIAGLCLVLSLAAPALELLPFVITGVGFGVSAFGLALLAHDGLLALIAYLFCGAVVSVVALATL
jgi:hypothetical protein